jgi:hemerythrin-like metal-binding protein
MIAAQQPLTWREEFATGVPEIDEQHMILVHTLNESASKLAHDASQETLEQITQDLLGYALYHFETEEELMQRYGYAEEDTAAADLHLGQHRAFSAKVVSVREDLKAGVKIVAADLLEFLNSWLVNHILNTDRKLGAFIVEKRAQSALR